MNGMFGLNQIEQIAIPALDVERATAFYREQLGMKYLFTSNGLAFFDCGGIRIMLGRPESEGGKKASSVLYFKVEDIQATYEALNRRGVAFLDAPHFIASMGETELWMAFFRDSEENILAISGDVRPAHI